MSVVKQLFALGLLVSPCAVATAAPESTGASVDVTFTDPDKYIDAKPHERGTKERDAALVKLRQHLEKQSARFLKPDQKLQIEVLDIDLAGRVDWWNPQAYDIRVMRDIDSPSMKVRYTLTENGAVLASGEERISDLGYLQNITGTASSNDPLKYDKAMLTDWFRKRFAKFGGSAD